MSRLAAVFLLLLLGVNCSPAVQSTALGTAHPPRAPNAEVLTYSVRTPECAFEEIALVTVEQQPSVYFIGVEKPLAAMEKRARRLGGDAIIGLTQLPRVEGFLGGLRGTVIRFTEESCRH